MTVIVVENKDKVIEKLCELIERAAKESIDKGDVFLIGVSGGSLAVFLEVGLPKIKSDFSKWRLFFCDERVVPVDNPDSTYGLYKRALVDSGLLGLKPDQFVQIKQGVPAEEAAIDYENQLKKFFPSQQLPQFDMLLLGMGPDGHTCSLFPGHPLLSVTDRWIAPITDSPKPPPSRVTMTFPVVNNARVCVFATGGKEKADMIKKVLVDQDEQLPAARVKPHSGAIYWIVDQDAGVHIKNKV
ncbi:6-phosphogluconolactonase [Diabrotica virgifera virgifera]|uniref:6-phosphogluconolactonase n=1 Tax=Diabrotica virgifera virgifera TaxID=50390 RepID=A0ABM5L735_DIAVI|nr:6-phosphogluconolactonase [Diabrotica virgifera virgifera]